MKTKLLAVALSGIFATSAANAELFISEYVEGSSYNKALEIYNPSETEIDLSGYQITFYFNGKTTPGYTINLEGSISTQGTYVVAHGSAAQQVLDAAQQVKSGSWFNGDDALVLTKDGVIIDRIGQIGVDPGSSWYQDGVSTKDKTLRRLDSITQGDSDAYAEFNPAEQWQAFAKNSFDDLGKYQATDGDDQDSLVLGACHEQATLISQVQGDSDTSPLKGEQVVVEAVVTASFQQSNQLKGFFIQEEANDQDSNPATSEGLFVYDTSINVAAGDQVRLLAKVDEYYGATQLSQVQNISICGQNISVAASEISLPLAQADDLEAVEGMLVTLNQPLTVVDNYGLARYGEVVLASERLYTPTQIATPGDAANQVKAANALKTLVLDDGSTGQNPDLIPYPAPELTANNSLRTGDQVNGLTGVLTYGFSKYRLHPTQAVNFVKSNPRTEAPVLAEKGELKVASFNVLNYFNGDGQGAGYPTPRGADNEEEFIRQRDKTIAAILAMDAHLIGLMEMENDGFGEFSAIVDLVKGLNANSQHGEWAFVDFHADNIGTDKITSAIIYRKDMLKETGNAAFTTVVPFDYGNRAPIAQTFKDLSNGDELTFVVAHLRSKGSCSRAQGADKDLGDDQGCWNQTRVTAVNELVNWLNAFPTGKQEKDYLIVGDMNSYAMEDPITAFKAAGLSALKENFLGLKNHSYVYRGEAGSLDHALASANIAKKVTAVTDWHINADEPIALDYNTNYKSEMQKANLYAADPYRASDHDPVIIEVDTYQEFDFDFGTVSGNPGWRTYELELPQGIKHLEVNSTAGQGDMMLFVEHNKKPTTGHYDCASTDKGTTQQCVLENPAAGTWYIRVRGGRYQNVELNAYAHN